MQSDKGKFLKCVNKDCTNIIERLEHEAPRSANGGDADDSPSTKHKATSLAKRVLHKSSATAGGAKIERGLDGKPLSAEGAIQKKKEAYIFSFFHASIL